MSSGAIQGRNGIRCEPFWIRVSGGWQQYMLHTCREIYTMLNIVCVCVTVWVCGVGGCVGVCHCVNVCVRVCVTV